MLIQEGYIMRTQRGRIATEAAYKHLGRVYQDNGLNLF